MLASANLVDDLGKGIAVFLRAHVFDKCLEFGAQHPLGQMLSDAAGRESERYSRPTSFKNCTRPMISRVNSPAILRSRGERFQASISACSWPSGRRQRSPMLRLRNLTEDASSRWTFTRAALVAAGAPLAGLQALPPGALIVLTGSTASVAFVSEQRDEAAYRAAVAMATDAFET